MSKADPTNDLENTIIRDVDNLETKFKEYIYHYNKNKGNKAFSQRDEKKFI